MLLAAVSHEKVTTSLAIPRPQKGDRAFDSGQPEKMAFRLIAYVLGNDQRFGGSFHKNRQFFC